MRLWYENLAFKPIPIVYNKDMNLSHQKFSNQHHQALKEVAKFFNVKLTIMRVSGNDLSGMVQLFDDEEIFLFIPKVRCCVDEVFSVFFHELAHIRNKQTKKFKIFHYYDPIYFNLKEWNHFFKVMGRAELYTEKVGKELMSIFFPKINYVHSYTKKNIKKSMQELKQEIKNHYPIFRKKDKCQNQSAN